MSGAGDGGVGDLCAVAFESGEGCSGALAFVEAVAAAGLGEYGGVALSVREGLWGGSVVVRGRRVWWLAARALRRRMLACSISWRSCAGMAARRVFILVTACSKAVIWSDRAVMTNVAASMAWAVSRSARNSLMCCSMAGR
ncbi:hypothetical protein ACWCPF_45160 [Streptomyces sp. NPDC001858]